MSNAMLMVTGEQMAQIAAGGTVEIRAYGVAREVVAVKSECPCASLAVETLSSVGVSANLTSYRVRVAA